MPSRRRSRSKNLNNNLSDVQRRLRSLERRPVRTKLAGRVVTKAAIAPNSVSEDEVSFGTAVVVPPGGDIDDVVGQIENPKDGLLVVDTDSGSSKLYSQEDDSYVDITDPIAQQAADDAAADALAAQQAADDAAADAAAALSAAGDAASDAAAAEVSANGKSAVFRQATEPTTQVGGGALRVGDIWFDTTTVTAPSGTPDTTGSRPRRYAGPGGSLDARWPSFGLNYLAVSSIDANNIVTGTLTGRIVRTASAGRRVELSNTNELIFRGTTIISGTDTAVVGKIAPDLFGGLGLDIIGGNSTATSSSIQLRSSEYTLDASITMLTPNGYGVYVYNTTDSSEFQSSSGGVLINGGGATENTGSLKLYSGGGGFEFIDWSGSVYGTTIYAYNDQLSIGSGVVSISGDKVELLGDLVLGFGTYQQGSGQPSGTAATGTVVFRYT
jgi:hypothetical protein